ncbi:dihydroxyacetone kinase phosphoryl donor subunit DhaM [Psychromicrobium xiongbiense]|uniref:dihydroxyacetone kinase phosphoryl donor subunit DhaM n=1 Tax=Psychromicrobium xiongbiense TaxID=3051184 RepID=UPI0025529A9A|nr:dihydroxyacetone kinase phosphoryl donor subunit DhaM [Psychromicrobium sp. YIM S02556]
MSSEAPVAIIIVSHSATLAQGVVELAAQMAPRVRLIAAGGMDDGGLGTSLTKVTEALEAAGPQAVLLADLGSAVMTAETALEFAGNPTGVLLADAPLVEGAVAAAVAAQAGAGVEAVQRAAEQALSRGVPDGVVPDGGGLGGAVGAAAEAAAAGAWAAPGDVAVTAELTLINPMGLHARPAATLAGALGALDVDIEINGVDAQSVMLLMTLGAGQGAELHVRASGPDAQRAVDLVRREVETGFGEL